MKEQKRKYDRPLMERVLVELEDGFCAASANVQNPDNDEYGKIKPHEVNTGFGTNGTLDFSNDSWGTN